MRPETPFGFTVFCDDIREELGGKASYIGVYSGSLIVHTGFPVTVSKLCFATTYYQRTKDERRPVELRVTVPGEGEDALAIQGMLPVEAFDNVAPNLAIDDPMVLARVNMILSPFTIVSPGFIKVRAMYGDEEIRMGLLQIVEAQPAEASDE